MADSYDMMAFGDYRFGLSIAAYQELERTTAWRWEAAIDPAGVNKGGGADAV